MKIILIIIFLIFSVNKLSASVLFETDEFILKFNSNNINVDKENKIDQLKLKSFSSILKKILNNKNYQNLEKEIDLSFVNKFILNIKINNEKIIGDNYYSKIKINFNIDLIIDYFITNKINYIDSIPENFLLVVFEEDNIKNQILSRNNKIYSHILNSNEESLNDNYLIPNLDFNDRFIINENNINLKNILPHIKLNKKYKIEYQIFIHMKKENNFYNVKYYLFDKNKKIYVNSKKLKQLKYNQLLQDIYYESLDKWKTLNEINISSVTNLDCRLAINNVYELKFFLKVITSLRIIDNFNLKYIKYKENIYTLSFFGDIDILKKSLKNERLNLFFINNECNIKLK